MNKTQIEWVRNPDGSQGYTFNPITGCLNHVNGMCRGGGFPCYAYRLAHGRLRERYLANTNMALQYAGMGLFASGDYADPFYPRFWPEKISQPEKRKKPAGIFVCDMSDLFGKGIPERWIESVLASIRRSPQHRFYLLTKQPQNLIKFSPFPPNCWVGVTATSTEFLMQACSLLEYPLEAKVKYLSLEPLLNWEWNWTQSYLVNTLKRADIKWLIIGAQTKPSVYPKIEWVQEIVEACNHAGIPIFLKNNLKPFLDTQPTRIVYQYGSGKLRQEMPNAQAV